MVSQQLARRDIGDRRVLEAMGRVPRHAFVSPPLWDQAYEDYPLPIDEGQTISQPYIVALMTQSLKLKPGNKVLEVGTGSGYQAAVLADMAVEVYSIEIRCELAEKADKVLKQLGYEVQVKCGDGYFGWEEHAPFDGIMITSAARRIPQPLVDQLKEGGRLILPLGSVFGYQVLTLITKVKGKAVLRDLGDVRFVPMIGEVDKKK